MPVVQWLGCRTPNPLTQVRVLPGMPQSLGAVGSARHPVTVEVTGSNPVGTAKLFMKELVKQIKALNKEAKTRLAEIRRAKRESRPPKSSSRRMAEFIKARQSVEADAELFMINRLLDLDDLTDNERNSLRFRKNTLLNRSPREKTRSGS